MENHAAAAAYVPSFALLHSLEGKQRAHPRPSQLPQIASGSSTSSRSSRAAADTSSPPVEHADEGASTVTLARAMASTLPARPSLTRAHTPAPRARPENLSHVATAAVGSESGKGNIVGRSPGQRPTMHHVASTSSVYIPSFAVRRVPSETGTGQIPPSSHTPLPHAGGGLPHAASSPSLLSTAATASASAAIPEKTPQAAKDNNICNSNMNSSGSSCHRPTNTAAPVLIPLEDMKFIFATLTWNVDLLLILLNSAPSPVQLTEAREELEAAAIRSMAAAERESERRKRMREHAAMLQHQQQQQQQQQYPSSATQGAETHEAAPAAGKTARSSVPRPSGPAPMPTWSERLLRRTAGEACEDSGDEQPPTRTTHTLPTVRDLDNIPPGGRSASHSAHEWDTHHLLSRSTVHPHPRSLHAEEGSSAGARTVSITSAPSSHHSHHQNRCPYHAHARPHPRLSVSCLSDTASVATATTSSTPSLRLLCGVDPQYFPTLEEVQQWLERGGLRASAASFWRSMRAAGHVGRGEMGEAHAATPRGHSRRNRTFCFTATTDEKERDCAQGRAARVRRRPGEAEEEEEAGRGGEAHAVDLVTVSEVGDVDEEPVATHATRPTPSTPPSMADSPTAPPTIALHRSPTWEVASPSTLPELNGRTLAGPRRAPPSQPPLSWSGANMNSAPHPSPSPTAASSALLTHPQTPSLRRQPSTESLVSLVTNSTAGPPRRSLHGSRRDNASTGGGGAGGISGRRSTGGGGRGRRGARAAGHTWTIHVRSMTEGPRAHLLYAAPTVEADRIYEQLMQLRRGENQEVGERGLVKSNGSTSGGGSTAGPLTRRASASTAPPTAPLSATSTRPSAAPAQRRRTDWLARGAQALRFQPWTIPAGLLGAAVPAMATASTASTNPFLSAARRNLMGVCGPEPQPESTRRDRDTRGESIDGGVPARDVVTCETREGEEEEEEVEEDARPPRRTLVGAGAGGGGSGKGGGHAISRSSVVISGGARGLPEDVDDAVDLMGGAEDDVEDNDDDDDDDDDDDLAESGASEAAEPLFHVSSRIAHRLALGFGGGEVAHGVLGKSSKFFFYGPPRATLRRVSSAASVSGPRGRTDAGGSGAPSLGSRVCSTGDLPSASPSPTTTTTMRAGEGCAGVGPPTGARVRTTGAAAGRMCGARGSRRTRRGVGRRISAAAAAAAASVTEKRAARSEEAGQDDRVHGKGRVMEGGGGAEVAPAAASVAAAAVRPGAPAARPAIRSFVQTFIRAFLVVVVAQIRLRQPPAPAHALPETARTLSSLEVRALLFLRRHFLSFKEIVVRYVMRSDQEVVRRSAQGIFGDLPSAPPACAACERSTTHTTAPASKAEGGATTKDSTEPVVHTTPAAAPRARAKSRQGGDPAAGTIAPPPAGLSYKDVLTAHRRGERSTGAVGGASQSNDAAVPSEPHPQPQQQRTPELLPRQGGPPPPHAHTHARMQPDLLWNRKLLHALLTPDNVSALHRLDHAQRESPAAGDEGEDVEPLWIDQLYLSGKDAAWQPLLLDVLGITRVLQCYPDAGGGAGVGGGSSCAGTTTTTTTTGMSYSGGGGQAPPHPPPTMDIPPLGGGPTPPSAYALRSGAPAVSHQHMVLSALKAFVLAPTHGAQTTGNSNSNSNSDGDGTRWTRASGAMDVHTAGGKDDEEEDRDTLEDSEAYLRYLTPHLGVPWTGHVGGAGGGAGSPKGLLDPLEWMPYAYMPSPYTSATANYSMELRVARLPVSGRLLYRWVIPAEDTDRYNLSVFFQSSLFSFLQGGPLPAPTTESGLFIQFHQQHQHQQQQLQTQHRTTWAATDTCLGEKGNGLAGGCVSPQPPSPPHSGPAERVECALVHCSAGMHRSCGMVVAFLLWLIYQCGQLSRLSERLEVAPVVNAGRAAGEEEGVVSEDSAAADAGTMTVQNESDDSTKRVVRIALLRDLSLLMTRTLADHVTPSNDAGGEPSSSLPYTDYRANPLMADASEILLRCMAHVKQQRSMAEPITTVQFLLKHFAAELQLP